MVHCQLPDPYSQRHSLSYSFSSLAICLHILQEKNISLKYNVTIAWYLYLAELQTQTKYRSQHKSQWLLTLQPWEYWLWWCWRCWPGQGTEWWAASSARAQCRGEWGSWSRRPWRTCRRGGTRWWCSETPSSSESSWIQPLSSSNLSCPLCRSSGSLGFLKW